MVNFIVCEDNKIILQRNVDIINQTMFENNIDYRIYPFSKYSNLLKEIIKDNKANKIYILDIELDEISGIDIARDIRNIDLKSLIIISTSHTEYLPYTLKSKLMLFDYVSKFEDYEQNLSNVIKRALESYSLNKYIDFKYKDKNKRILLKDVIFIRYDEKKECTIIRTKDRYYQTLDSFNSIAKYLDNRFEMKAVNYYKNTINFTHNKSNLSHKTKKKGV